MENPQFEAGNTVTLPVWLYERMARVYYGSMDAPAESGAVPTEEGASEISVGGEKRWSDLLREPKAVAWGGVIVDDGGGDDGGGDVKE